MQCRAICLLKLTTFYLFILINESYLYSPPQSNCTVLILCFYFYFLQLYFRIEIYQMLQIYTLIIDMTIFRDGINKSNKICGCKIICGCPILDDGAILTLMSILFYT